MTFVNGVLIGSQLKCSRRYNLVVFVVAIQVMCYIPLSDPQFTEAHIDLCIIKGEPLAYYLVKGKHLNVKCLEALSRNRGPGNIFYLRK